MKTLCIYHGNCADGFGAAWVVRKRLGSGVEFHAGVYGNEPPPTDGRDVLLVDFSYKRSVLKGIIERSRTLVVLDHHKTARDDLAGLDGIRPGVEIIFDMERSGAGLTWDHFYPGEPRPALIDRIEDRDLWRFRYADTRAVQANVFSHPYDFDVWDKLFDSDLRDLAREGEAIERKHFKDVNELLSVARRTMTIAGYAVPAASLPYTLASDAGNAMAKGERFAATYYDTAERRVFSLRSTEGGMDVSQIAAGYGGGGHEHAAGFAVPRDHDLAKA